MELDEVLKNRKSCRSILIDRRIPFDTFDAIQWAGASAPYASGGPRRNTHIIFDPAQKAKDEGCLLQSRICGRCRRGILCFWVRIQALCSHPDIQSMCFDCAAAAMCMDLMAVSLGLATCWIGHF